MAEEVKKKRATTPQKKQSNRGGARPGAGRKPGFRLKENPRNRYATFTVSEKTLNQIRTLRDLTRQDDVNFNGMFILWVEDLAKEYGIE